MRRNNMSSTNKTSLGLNMWEASDKPVRQDFVNDNTIIDDKITQLNSNLALKANASALENTNTVLNSTTNALNYRISSRVSIRWDDAGALQLFIDNTYVGVFKLV